MASGVTAFIASKSHRTIYMKGVFYISLFFVFILILSVLEFNKLDDLSKTLLIICKWVALISSSVALFASSKSFDFVESLKSFKVPKGFTFALGIGFRFIPIIFEEIGKISLAQKARGLNIGRGVKGIFKIPIVLKSISIPLLRGIMLRLEGMYLTLKVRGFELEKQRSQLKFKWSILNLGLFIYSIVIIILSIIY